MEHRRKLSEGKRGAKNPFYATKPWNFNLQRSGMTGKKHSLKTRNKMRAIARERQRDALGRLIGPVPNETETPNA